jgi:death-on-curing protein
MEEASGRITIPTVAQIVTINQTVIEATIGRFVPPTNLINETSLRWVLETIQHPVLFGENPYPRLCDKAALLAWEIINSHVFLDGNKRTGMITSQVLMLLNGFYYQATDQDVVEQAQRIVAWRENGLGKQELANWIEDRKKPFSNDFFKGGERETGSK